MRILLVEDNQRLSAALKAQLEKDGYAVDALADGAQGLVYAEEIAYDLIILDIMLPRKDGLAVCRERATLPPSPPSFAKLGINAI